MKESSFEVFHAMKRCAKANKDYKVEMTAKMKANVKARIDKEIERINHVAEINKDIATAENDYKTAYKMYDLLARN